MQVKLRTNAWHVRLQRWTFGDITYRMHLCGYFWLTVFCVIAAPFVACFHGIVGLCSSCSTLLVDARAARKETGFDRAARALSLEEAYRLHCLDASFRQLSVDEMVTHPFWDNFRLRAMASKFLPRWKELHPDWQELFQRPDLPAMFIAWQQELEREKLRQRALQRRREEVLNRIAAATKTIVYAVVAVLIIVFLGVVAVGIFKLVRLLVLNFWTIPWAVVGRVVGVSIVLAAILVGTIVGLQRLKWRADEQSWKARDRAPEPDRPGLLRLYFLAAKENYCPKVEWVDGDEDEDRPS